MNKSILKWTSLMMVMALVTFSCGSDDKEEEEDPQPAAGFTFAVDEDDYRVVEFTNTSANATEYEWDFGDDSDLSTEEDPTHQYTETGTFTVTLKAKNGDAVVSKSQDVVITPVLTNTILNGGGAKAWTLKPAGGSFIVGPTIGSGEWYPGNDGEGHPKDLSGERPCLFNDQFIFKTENVYEYDSQGDIWAEGYMGYGEGDINKCQDEETMPESGAAWGSGTHSYSFTKASASSPAKIAVTGTGAFIVLPKTKNGGEYAAGPPDANGTVTYDVVSYNVEEDGTEVLVVTINFGPGYWTYTLIHENE
jgi:PKD repeat protein